MKSTLLWRPTAQRIDDSRLGEFQTALTKAYGLSFENYEDLHRWSVTDPERFWAAVWEFSGVCSSRLADSVTTDGDKFPGARWFEGARLNYAENLLSGCGSGVAIVSYLENGRRSELTWSELRDQVAMMAAALKRSGVVEGDRVACMLPNVPEAIVAMLATASLGAMWSSCSPDFGVNGVLDRFGQIDPKVLIACDGYYYGGKTLDCRDKIAKVAAGLPTLRSTIMVGVLGVHQPPEGIEVWGDYLEPKDGAGVPPLEFTQLAFDHPLFIMYSSGTTGVPKCIVHGAGGTLLQHLKEHQLHVGLRAGDVLFYFTTCGWMMWNWMVSGLATGATLVLYDGSPFHPNPNTLFDIVDNEGITVFGVGAKYISGIEKVGLKPRNTHQLKSLKTILSTGSPLSHESFRFVYSDIKLDVCLSSISGGTDIISCFVLGNECLPVYEGEIQCSGLGMAMEVWDEDGTPVSCKKGELVCTRPFPSAPLGFWNDPDGSRYFNAYFANYPNVWAHGDYAELTENGGVIIHGRSDAVLNPGGVRIGTAEIYRQVDSLDDIVESICIGQEWNDDVRVVLFVVLRIGKVLDEALVSQIRKRIREETTPRHVPAKIIQVNDIPRTRSGKIAEIAVRDVVNGKAVANLNALSNPEALAAFRDMEALQL